MSDMLQKLLGVEKTAASLVAEAEAEAGRLVSRARQEAQRHHADLLKARAEENDRTAAAEQATLDAERQKRARAEQERLEKLPLDGAAFRATAMSFIEMGQK